MVCQDDNGDFVLLELLAGGGCAIEGIPGVYTNVRK